MRHAAKRRRIVSFAEVETLNIALRLSGSESCVARVQSEND